MKYLISLLLLICSACSPSAHSIRSRIFKFTSQHGACSAEQVHSPSGKDYVLTAAHCIGLLDDQGMGTITTEDGREIQRHIVAEDKNSDLLLLEGVPGIRGLDVAPFSRPHDHVTSYTHGHGFDEYETEGHLIQLVPVLVVTSQITDEKQEAKCASMPKNEVVDVEGFFGADKLCVLNIEEMATDTFLRPGSSGGALVNDDGELTNICSAGDQSGYSYVVTTYDIRQFLKNY